MTEMENSEWRDKKKFFECEYFATTRCVIKCSATTTSPTRWSMLHRKSTRDNPVAINVRRKNTSSRPLDPYTVTRESIRAENDGVASNLSTRTESDNSTTARAAIWSTDIFGRKSFNPKLAQIAHVVPAGKFEHEEWFGVAGAILGLDENSSVEHKLMALRGVKKKRKQDEPIGEESSTGGKKDNSRVHNSGYLHSASNKLRLQGQAGVVDGEQPKMLIIPSMTLDDAKAWRGQGYMAAVLVGLPQSDVPLGYTLDEENEKNVYTDIALNTSKLYSELKKGNRALLTLPHDEENTRIQIACDALAATVLGMAQYVRTLKSCDLSLLRTKNQALLRERSANCQGDVCVPQFCRSGDQPILFVRFGSQTGSEMDLHPAPDPLGLLCKAANGFSLMVGQKLLANEEPPELTDYDYELQELDHIAEIEYLIGGSGQPFTPQTVP